MEQGKEPEQPARVRVTMLRPVRMQEAPNRLPRDLFGEQELDAPTAIAWSILGYCKPAEGWVPDPKDCASAAEIGLTWLQYEQRGRSCTDADFERIPANARRLRALLALTGDSGPSNAA